MRSGDEALQIAFHLEKELIVIVMTQSSVLEHIAMEAFETWLGTQSMNECKYFSVAVSCQGVPGQIPW